MWRSQLIFASFTTMFANSFSRLKMHPFCPLFHPSSLRPPPFFSMTVMENNENPSRLSRRKLTVSREGIGIQYYIYHQFLIIYITNSFRSLLPWEDTDMFDTPKSPRPGNRMFLISGRWYACRNTFLY